MIALFGYGMGGEIKNIPVVVVTQSNGTVTDATLDAIKGVDLYDVKGIITDPNEGKQMVENGQVKAAIILPSDYENMSTRSGFSSPAFSMASSPDETIAGTVYPANSSPLFMSSAVIRSSSTTKIFASPNCIPSQFLNDY